MKTNHIDHSPVHTTVQNERREYIIDKNHFMIGLGAGAVLATAIGGSIAYGEHQPVEEKAPLPYVETALVGDKIANGEEVKGATVEELPIDEGENPISVTTEWAKEQLEKSGKELTSEQENIITGTAIEARDEFDEIIRPGAIVKVFQIGDNFGVSEIVENGPIDTGN